MELVNWPLTFDLHDLGVVAPGCVAVDGEGAGQVALEEKEGTEDDLEVEETQNDYHNGNWIELRSKSISFWAYYTGWPNKNGMAYFP